MALKNLPNFIFRPSLPENYAYDYESIKQIN